jgi:hypothetical protein
MERVNFYVDGFNFYYGLKRMKATDPDRSWFYWIDFVQLFQHFTGENENQILQKIYYFTAPPLSINKANRQRILFKANELINGSRFEVINGMFYEKQFTCPNCNIPFTRPEEKRTDVNISVKMMGDCALNCVDTLVLVCADSDLIPPLQFIKQHYPEKKIKVYFPPDNYSGALNAFMKSFKKKVIRLENNKSKFLNSIMPDVVTRDGTTYTIPPNGSYHPKILLNNLNKRQAQKFSGSALRSAFPEFVRDCFSGFAAYKRPQKRAEKQNIHKESPPTPPLKRSNII